MIIFDDFERSKLSQSETLSKINEFIEHRKLKAIILCDERAVEDEKYYQTKEKVVLYTSAFERTPDEIVSICLKEVRDLEGIQCDTLEAELTKIVEQFNLTNIRTIKHGLECFRDIAAEILKEGSKYQYSPVFFEILFSSLALSVGYKDYSVPVEELKKTVRKCSDMAVAYHMKELREQSNKETPSTNWERFYENILKIDINNIEFESVFELVCRGHLDKSAILKDLERWEGKGSRPDSPITNFRIDQPISASEFQSHIDTAHQILDDRSYAFYSTAELYSFCKSLYFIYDHKGFKYNGNFDEKLKEFATLAVNNCQNHTEPSAFGCRNDDYEIVKTIFAHLAKRSEELSEAQIVKSARKKLLSDLEKGVVERIVDSGDNAFSKSIIDSDFITSLKSIYPTLDNASIRALGIFIKNRFKNDSDFETYKDELAPLAKLDEYLKQYLKDDEDNLATMMAFILSNAVSSVVSKSKKLAVT